MSVGARRYLVRLKSTRQLIECSIGILKEQFPCLNHLRLRKPEACSKVFLMCVTLHNIQNEFRHNRHDFVIEHDNCKYFLDEDVDEVVDEHLGEPVSASAADIMNDMFEDDVLDNV